MSDEDAEARRLAASALKSAESILVARRRAEQELRDAKEALEHKTVELQQQRQWLAVTLSSIGDAVIATDREGRVTFVNPVAEALTGLPAAQALAQPLSKIFQVVDEQTGAAVESPVAQVLESGRVVGMTYHTVLLSARGDRTAIEDSAAPIRDADGRVTGAVMVFHDVTERRRAESALRARDALLRATFDQAAVGIAVTSIDDRFVEVNPKFCEIVGYSLDELADLRIEQITHPDDRGESRRRIDVLIAGAQTKMAQEKRYQRKDGRCVWVRTTVTMIKPGAIADARFVRVVEDITDRRHAEEALLEESRILELLNATGISIAAELDLKSLVQRVTDAATALSGAQFGAFFYSVTDLQGEAYVLYALSGAPREAFEKFGLPRNTAVFKPTFEGDGVVRSDDITADPRYGRNAPHCGMPQGHLPVRSYLAVPVVSRSSDVIGGMFFGHPQTGVFTERIERLLVGVAAQAAVAIDNAKLYEAAQREISSRERAENALRETDRRKDEFLAILAHELRNPLAPIRQAAMIARAPGASDAQRRWSHEVIGRQVRHMALLLDDLLDISRITRGTLGLRIQTTLLARVVEEAIETARPVIDAKRHSLSIEFTDTDLRIAADPLRLAQVISNLLTNAAKYTDAGGAIGLHVDCDAQTVVIRVTDTGIGIAPDSIDEVFTMFSQVRSSQDRSEGGLGIGLALARGLLELHGGTIDAHSAGPGQGSEFTLRLPRRALEEATEAPDAEPPVNNAVTRRVLIADDNHDAADSLAALIRLDGHEVVVVHDGEAAMRAFTEHRPDFALLDIGMPRLNGYEVARRVRAEASSPAVTLIAVTGWGQDNDKLRATEAGFNHHFTKPVEPSRLSELLRGAAV